MTILNILYYPDKRLHTTAKPVPVVNDQVRKLVDDMAETMYDAPGVGLAATQVNVHQQVIVIDISEARNQLLTLINPQLVSQQGEQDHEEGCLSVPGIYETVRRAEQVEVSALDREGNRFTVQANGLLAVCIQHEMDHLQGRVFVEYLSQLKQSRIVNKLKKQRRVR